MWVARSIALALLAASCDLPAGPTASASPSTPASSATASCKLPVWWGEATGLGLHAAFVSVPGGAITDAGTIFQPPELTVSLLSGYYFGLTYVTKTRTWVGVNDSVLSPSGDRVVYLNYVSAT